MKKTTPKMPGSSLQILGVGVSSTSEVKALKFVRKNLKKKKKFWIATPNPEMLVKAQRQAWFKRALNASSLAIPDGIGLVLASKILFGRKGLKKRVAGVDFMLALCRQARKEGWKVFLLGGRPGVAGEALEVLKNRFPGLEGKAYEGPRLRMENGQLKVEKEENEKAIKMINKFRPHLLFVGFGMGKQEVWIVKFLPKLKVGGAMVVGGSFDLISGRARRAPKILQKKGLEWLWRLIFQPWRIKRQLALLEFLFLVGRQKLATLRGL